MTIASEELKLYLASSGRISSTEVVDSVKNGLFRNVTEAEQAAGITITEKAFFKVANDADTQAVNARTFIADITPSDGRAILYDATQRDTTPIGRKYGAGRLNADVSAAAISIVVDAETGAGADLIYQVGDEIYINDGTNNEFAIVYSIVWSTDEATIGLTVGLENGYSAATPTTVSSCIESVSIECSTDNWVETSTSGTYDETGSPITNDNLGGIEQTWTLTFTSTTDFSVVGDVIGSAGSGTIAGDFSPSNADFAKPYFTLLAAGWGGSWVVSDTIVFQTHPAAQPFFCDLIIAAGAAAYSNDDIQFSMVVESA